MASFLITLGNFKISGANNMAKKAKTKKKLHVFFTSFTYYIPAPPGRKTGYREKEFDKIISGILQSGFEIVSTSTQAVSSELSAGVFYHFILKTNNPRIHKLDLTQEIQENFKLQHSHSSPDIILEDENI
jgi:hypothetical protein